MDQDLNISGYASCNIVAKLQKCFCGEFFMGSVLKELPGKNSSSGREELCMMKLPQEQSLNH